MRPLIKVISTMRDLLISFNARSTSQLLVLVAAGTLHIYIQHRHRCYLRYDIFTPATSALGYFPRS